jgi:hypothetical protein
MPPSLSTTTRSTTRGASRHPDHEEVLIITRRGFDVVTIAVTKFIPLAGCGKSPVEG